MDQQLMNRSTRENAQQFAMTFINEPKHDHGAQERSQKVMPKTCSASIWELFWDHLNMISLCRVYPGAPFGSSGADFLAEDGHEA